jgi:hypothetical protein
MKRNAYFTLLLVAVAALAVGDISYSGSGSNGESGLTVCHGSGPLTTTGTSKQTLATCTIPANAVAPGSYRGLEIHLYGQHKAGNTNSITLGVDIGSWAGAIARVSTASAEGVAAVLWCSYSATNEIVCHGMQSVSGGTTSGNIYASGPVSVTLTSDITVNFFGTTGTAAGDVILQAYSIRLIR